MASFPPEGLLEAARVADNSGLDDLWLWEDCFTHGGLSTTAAALSVTTRIRVGIGLLPVPLRNVAVTAMEFASLSRLFPGRTRVAVGHGVQEWMGQVGARVASPMTLLDEYHSALRRLLDGQCVSVKGTYVTLESVQLSWPPCERLPLLLGGSGPKSLRLAARVGDGNLLDAGLSEAEIASACALIGDELAIRPDVGSLHEIGALLIAATGSGSDRRVVDEAALWRHVPDAEVGVAGDAHTIAGAVMRLADLGVTAVTIQPTADEPDLAGFIRFLGNEVRPLLCDSLSPALEW